MVRRPGGRVAVVTGAGSGLGRAVAERLAADGLRVVCAEADEPAGRAVARSVGGLFVHTDPRDADMVEALYDEAYETCGGVDLAVHPVAPGPASRAALPYLRRHGHGVIVNLTADPADRELSAELARSYGREGIRVYGLRPGAALEPAVAAVAFLAGPGSAFLAPTEFVADDASGKIIAGPL
ncbi:short-chain dehydrogenase [Kitasatospora sp. MMS16-BH015]|uniref:SDR family NAD(P)-dependent oxidoreductase n=1 Tax=Kitasatospora sp. MMS16-BH015 TaxID=2018025 RepID=UPI000CA14B35|nr:SDR family NAD(P)-dependent oxidoreductase [Kitasatospora sp. MMS16-BH015]AUG76085.1 short-chain dehydrogenase [Kitasatospora sp. MMS16-BH015]